MTGVSAESGHLRCHNEEVVNMLVRLETQLPMQRAQDDALEIQDLLKFTLEGRYDPLTDPSDLQSPVPVTTSSVPVCEFSRKGELPTRSMLPSLWCSRIIHKNVERLR